MNSPRALLPLPILLLVLNACAAPGAASGGAPAAADAPATALSAASSPGVVGAGAESAAPAPDHAGHASAESSPRWRFAMTPYFWLFDIDGHARSPGGRDIPVSAHLSDAWDLVQDHLQFGFLGHFEATDGLNTVFLDGTYIHVSSEQSFAVPNPSGGPAGAGDLDVDVKLEQFEIGAGRVVGEFCGPAGKPAPVEAIGGARWNGLRTETDLTLAGGGAVVGFDRHGSTDWVDPFVGARTRVPLSDDLVLSLRADIGGGGFGDGSRCAWNVVAAFEWRITESMSAVVGYRWYDVDRDSGGHDSHLQFEGPGLGMVMRF